MHDKPIADLGAIIGKMPYRMAFAGGWIDQPFVSQLNPTPPGSMVVVAIEPTCRFMDRCGMGTSTRRVARQLWGDVLPDRDPAELVRDDLGNVVGGIRTPYVDVPIVQLSGAAGGGSTMCFLFGKTIPFDEATLDRLYPDHQTYVDAVAASTQEAVDAGFLLPEDADLIISAAENSHVGL